MNALCRPARLEDTGDVLELTKTIWDGHDYVPEVWHEWLADEQGQLLVAELKGEVVGISKLSRLSPQDWWMQGLRVHPGFEGRGIGSQLTEAIVQAWLEIGSGTVRLGTASFRLPVHHICSRLGFEKISELAPFYAPAKQDAQAASFFHPVLEIEIDQALEVAHTQPSLALAGKMIDLGWHYAPPRKVFLAAAVERGQAWWWRGRQACLTARLDEDDEQGIALSIEMLACEMDKLAQVLSEFRSLAAQAGFSQAVWMAPLHDPVVQVLQAAGYRRMWDDSLYIYAKDHPHRPAGGIPEKL